MPFPIPQNLPPVFGTRLSRLAGLKIIKKSETSTKDQVLEFVKKRLIGYEWPLRTLKSGPRKGHVIPADSCYDIADAYIVAIASVVG